VALLLRPL